MTTPLAPLTIYRRLSALLRAARRWKRDDTSLGGVSPLETLSEAIDALDDVSIVGDRDLDWQPGTTFLPTVATEREDQILQLERNAIACEAQLTDCRYHFRLASEQLAQAVQRAIEAERRLKHAEDALHELSCAAARAATPT